MGIAARGRVVCLLLLCLVGLGIVGMHSVVSVHSGQPSSVTQLVTDTDGAENVAVAGDSDTATASVGEAMHAGLHLCLAILAAAAFVLLVRFLRTTVPVASLAASRQQHRRIRPIPPGVPPSGGRDVLTGVCVLRV